MTRPASISNLPPMTSSQPKPDGRRKKSKIGSKDVALGLLAVGVAGFVMRAMGNPDVAPPNHLANLRARVPSAPDLSLGNPLGIVPALTSRVASAFHRLHPTPAEPKSLEISDLKVNKSKNKVSVKMVFHGSKPSDVFKVLTDPNVTRKITSGLKSLDVDRHGDRVMNTYTGSKFRIPFKYAIEAKEACISRDRHYQIEWQLAEPEGPFVANSGSWVLKGEGRNASSTIGEYEAQASFKNPLVTRIARGKMESEVRSMLESIEKELNS